jgi:transcriptional regulator with XRE-family HTH domain
MPDVQLFGAKLRALRQQRGLTLRELAEAIGYSAHGHLATIEQGKRRPSVEVALRISTYFGISLDLLMRDSVTVEQVLSSLPNDKIP